MNERDLQNLPHFNLNESIVVKPNLNLVDVMGEIGIRVVLTEIGVAEIKIRRHYDDWHSFDIDGHTPAGPVVAKVIIEEGHENKMESPLRIDVSVDDLEHYDLESLKCEFYYEDRVFYGTPAYDSEELRLDGKSTLRYLGWTEDDSDWYSGKDIFLPLSIEVFDKSRFIFRRGLKPLAKS